MTTIAERLMIRAAARRDPKAAERLELALRGQAFDVVLAKQRKRRAMISDNTDHTWPPRFVAAPARVRR
jgi:hypothetical protein